MATSARLGYNRSLHEPGNRWQLLGNGRRVFNPVLMRFHSPDSLSPFSRGGLNAYAYCLGNPVNLFDPSGLSPLIIASAAMAASKAAVAVKAGALARRPVMKLVDSSKTGTSNVWGSKAGSISAAGPVAAPRGRPPGPAKVAPARPPSPRPSSRGRSPSPDDSIIFGRRDEKGFLVTEMEKLPTAVRKRIVEIRDHGPHSRNPDPSKVGNGKFPENINNGQLPFDKTGRYYRRFVIQHGNNHDYKNWRIVTGSTPDSGIGVIFVTPIHDKKYTKVPDWSGYVDE